MRRQTVLLTSLLLLVGLLATGLALAADPEPAGDAHATEASTHGEENAAHGDDSHGEAAHGEAHGEGEPHGEHLELPHLMMVLRNIGPLANNETFNHYSHLLENAFFAVLAGLVLCVVAIRMNANRSDLPGRLQAMGEILVEQVLTITTTMMGEKDGRKYAPFVATIFVYLVAMNYSGMIPFGKAPTSTLINNISIAFCVFLYVQYTGIRRNGIGGYLHHLAGSPKDAVGWALSPLMFFLEAFGELIKPVSLSLRLFGNIFGEDTLLAVFALLGVVSVSLMGIPAWVGLPLHVPFLFLSLLLGLIQALVFSLLSTVYISLMLPHHHDEHEDDAEEAHVHRAELAEAQS